MKRPPGLIIRRWKTKKDETKEAFYYRAPRAGGKDDRKPIPLGTDYKAALIKWAEIAGEQLAKPKSGTVGDVYEKYMEWAGSKHSDLSRRTIADRVTYWGGIDDKRLNTAFGHVEINALKPEWMLQYFELRTSQISAKKELKFLSVLCNWGKARGMMTAPNPTDNIMKHMKIDEKRDIYVEDAWLNLVLKNGSQLVKDVLNFTYLCANRPDETAMAKFSDIDGNELVIRLTKTEKKGNAEKRITIDGPLKAYIDAQRNKKVRSQYLVSDDAGQKVSITGNFRRPFKVARDAAEIEAKERGIKFVRFQLKDIRAKSGTDICRDYGIEAARLALGHTTQKQTADYIRSVKGAASKARNFGKSETVKNEL